MERSTLLKDVKKEHQRWSNPSHSNSTKATSAREELERKNKSGNQQMTLRYRSNAFPSIRGGIDWWRFPLPILQEHARIIGGNGE
jgi:hypothetical protein